LRAVSDRHRTIARVSLVTARSLQYRYQTVGAGQARGE
jgi:hypothetical protein